MCRDFEGSRHSLYKSPFQSFREYVSQLVKYDKKFLIIGNQNAITYKEIFKLIKENKIWLGHSSPKEFLMPDHYPLIGSSYMDKDGKKWAKFGNVCWFTNLPVKKRSEPILLYRKYDPELYPKYDNYDAINVDKVKDIPMDYFGAMGVPITFLDKYNPSQFEIVSANDHRISDTVPFKEHGLIKDKDGTIDGKPTYARILIKRVKK